MSRLSRFRACATAVTLAALAAGCHRNEGPARYAVVQRDFVWHAEPAPADRAPLSLAWDFGGAAAAAVGPPRAATPGAADEVPTGAPQAPPAAVVATPKTAQGPGLWTAGATAAAGGAQGTTGSSLHDGVLTLHGRGTADLLGPGAGIVDPELHQWLTFRVATKTAASVSVQWRRAKEDFSPSRSTSELALDHSGAFASYQVSMATLRGVREAADAAEGVDEFRLRFRSAADGAELSVDVDEIALVSDDDSLDAQGVHAGRLDRLGIARHGIALRLPGTASVDVTGGNGDRLRFALALAGAAQPVDITVRERDGRLPEQHVTVQPGAGWAEHLVMLPEGALHVQFSATTAPDARAVLLVGSVLRLSPTAAARAPIVLYVEDTLRADHVTGAGYDHPTTPHLAEIAAQGVRFTHAWAAADWTRPSVSSLLTSLDPVAHGNQVHTRRIPASLTTLAEALAAQGYLTASFVTNYHAGAWSGLDQGFDAHGEPRAFGAASVPSTLTSDLIRDPIARFLAEHADEQVFVFAHSFDPHAPYEPLSDDVLALLRDPAPRASLPATAAAADRARFDKSTLDYDAEVLHNDRALAALDDTLMKAGLFERTLFAFVSDHGEAFADHGQWEHRQSLHEEELRVPWVLRLPGAVAAGARIDAPVSLIDLAPTLLGLVGLPAPPEWSGRDLSALCRAPPAATASSSAGAAQTSATAASSAPGAAPRAAPIFAEAVYDEPPRAGILHEVAVVVWPWKLIASVDAHGAPTAESLFALDSDPTERTDLLPRADLATQVAALLAIAREHLQRGPLRPAEDADAAGMDPALREWMHSLGYLR